MVDSSFVRDMYLHELGVGAGLVLWGFRACACQAENSRSVRRGFEHAVREESETVLADLRTFAYVVGFDGMRKVTLAQPGSARVTVDELLIVTVFAAAQSGNLEARDAHLLWLLAREPDEEISSSAQRVADAFARHRLRITTPAGVMVSTPQTTGASVHWQAGHA